MDNNIEKYRFGITLELNITVYYFVFPSIPPIPETIVQTVSINAFNYVIANVAGLTPLTSKIYIIHNETMLNHCRFYLNEFWNL